MVKVPHSFKTRYGEVRVSPFDEDRDGWPLWLDGEAKSFATLPEVVARGLGSRPEALRTYIENLLLIKLKTQQKKEAQNVKYRQEAERRRRAAAAEAERAQAQGDSGTGSAEEGKGASKGVILAGWRGWNYRRLSSGEPSLTPSFRGDPWHLVDVNHAVCKATESWHTSPYIKLNWNTATPNYNCTCGFWSYRSYGFMEGHGPKLDIRGVVALGGKRVHHEMGTRSASVRIVALLDSPVAQRFKRDWEEYHNPEPKRNESNASSGMSQTLKEGPFADSLNVDAPAADFPDLDKLMDGILTEDELDALRYAADSLANRPMTKSFPIPILSRNDCEMLAIEQGCEWQEAIPEPDETLNPNLSIRSYLNYPYPFIQGVPPPPQGASPTPEVGQYLMPAGGKIPNIKVGDRQYSPVTLRFYGAHEAPTNGMRVDQLLSGYKLGPNQMIEVHYAGYTVRLFSHKVKSPTHGDLWFWRPESGLIEFDDAFTQAEQRYGRDWLAQYKA